MTKDEEMYGLVCEKRFDRIDNKQEETIGLLKGSNGNPGVLDDVRNLKKWHKATIGFAIFVGSAFVLQVIGDVWTWVRAVF
jgi:hypothetical protein